MIFNENPDAAFFLIILRIHNKRGGIDEFLFLVLMMDFLQQRRDGKTYLVTAVSFIF